MHAFEPPASRRPRIAPAREVDDVPRHYRYDKRGHQVGDRERGTHRYREGLRERAGDAREEAERHEHDQRCQTRPCQRGHEFASGRQHGVAPGNRARPVGTVGPGAARDVFDHDDHVVDQQTDRGRDAAQRHDVEAQAEHAQHQHRRRERRRNDHHGDQGDAEAAQEHDQHKRRQHQSDQDGIAHARRRLLHELALIVPVNDLDAGRELERSELLLHRRRDLQRVAVRLLKDVEQDGRLAVLDDACPLRHDAVLHGRQITHTHNARRVGAHNDVADIGRRAGAVVGEDEIELVTIFDAANGLQHVSGRERGREIAHAEPVGRKPVRIGEHLDLLRFAALHIDAGKARD